MNPAEMLPLAVVIVATCCAAITDIRTFKIYHAVTVPLLLSGFLFRFLLGGWGDWEIASPVRSSASLRC